MNKIEFFKNDFFFLWSKQCNYMKTFFFRGGGGGGGGGGVSGGYFRFSNFTYV